jgi:hypothetical protein
MRSTTGPSSTWPIRTTRMVTASAAGFSCTSPAHSSKRPSTSNGAARPIRRPGAPS